MLQTLLSMAQSDANLSRQAKTLFATILAYVDDRGQAILDDAALAAQMGCCQKRLRGYRGELNSAGYCQARRSGAALFVQLPTDGRLFLTARNCHAERGKSATESVALFRAESATVETPAPVEVEAARECHGKRGKSATESVAVARSGGWMDGNIDLVNLNTRPTQPPQVRDNSRAPAREAEPGNEPAATCGGSRPAVALSPASDPDARGAPVDQAAGPAPGCVRLPRAGRTTAGQELSPEQIRANFDMLTDIDVGVMQHIDLFVTHLTPGDVFGLVLGWMRAGGGAGGPDAGYQYGPGLLVRWLQGQIRTPGLRNTRLMPTPAELEECDFVRRHCTWGVPAVSFPEEDDVRARGREPDEVADPQLPLPMDGAAGAVPIPVPVAPLPAPAPMPVPAAPSPVPAPMPVPAAQFQVPGGDLGAWLARLPGRLQGADLTVVAPDDAAAGWLLGHRHEVREAMARLAGRRILAVRVERQAVAA